jgi:hypothetical protein
MKKHHWHVFWHEKLFEKHPQPHCQTRSKCCIIIINCKVYLLKVQNRESDECNTNNKSLFSIIIAVKSIFYLEIY